MTSSMIRGFLKIVVLKALGKAPQSGYSLMKFVQEKVGVKPSPGSMYPLLENLQDEELVDVKGVGRRKEYRLTNQGRKQLSMIEEKREECLSKLVEGMKMMSALTGEDMSFPLAMVEKLRKGILPFKEINPEWDTLRNALFSMMKNNTLKKNSKRIRKALARANKEVRLA